MSISLDTGIVVLIVYWSSAFMCCKTEHIFYCYGFTVYYFVTIIFENFCFVSLSTKRFNISVIFVSHSFSLLLSLFIAWQ